MKDVLQHWPVADIKRFVDRNRRRFRYLLLTNDIASVHCPPELLNRECALGAWRTIDLERPPFGYRAGMAAGLRHSRRVDEAHHAPGLALAPTIDMALGRLGAPAGCATGLARC